MLRNEEYQSVTVRIGTCWSVGHVCIYASHLGVSALRLAAVADSAS